MSSDLLKNPPDLLAVAGAYSVPGRGGACVGVLCAPADEKLVEWNYSVYRHHAGAELSLKSRARNIASLLSIPQENDEGFGRMKAHYKRIRSLDTPQRPEALSSLVINQSTVALTMLRRLLPSIKADLDGFAFQIIPKEDEHKLILEWIDCLYSVILDKRIQFVEKHISAEILAALQAIEITESGRIKNPNILMMALVFSVGRAEYMAQTLSMPIQQMMRKRRA